MILSMMNQALVFALTILVGIIIGLSYDVFRIFRKIVHHKKFVIQVEDFLYWVSVSLGMFYIMLYNNNGEIRFFAIVGAFIGMAIYFYLLSKFVINASMYIVDFVTKVVKLLIEIVLTPFKLVYKILEYPLKIVKKRALKARHSSKKSIQKSKSYFKINGKRFANELKIIFRKH